MQKMTKPVLLISLLLLCILPGCVQPVPIKIGVVMTLTGRASTSGIRIRNGISLAVDEINNKGGINGRDIDLIIRDDLGNPEDALRIDKELIDEGVTAVLGHNFSTIAVETVPLFNEENVLMIGAVVSTMDLSGKDDNFIRLIPSVNVYASKFAQLMYDTLNYRSAAVVYDVSNISYTESQYNFFKSDFEKRGGEVKGAVTFNTNSLVAAEIAQKIVEIDAEALFVIANAIDAALICQHLRKYNSDINIIDSSWAASVPDFIKNGGQAIEGIVFLDLFNAESEQESMKKFSDLYFENFNESISLHAQVGYEVVQILADGLRQTTEPGKLKDVILKKKRYTGLDGEIIFDEYGDTTRPFYIKTIENGTIKTIGFIE